MSDLQPHHAKRNVETYEYLKKQDGALMKGFDKAFITVGMNFAKDVYTTVENPSDQKRAEEKNTLAI